MLSPTSLLADQIMAMFAELQHDVVTFFPHSTFHLKLHLMDRQTIWLCLLQPLPSTMLQVALVIFTFL